jgi:hypothetical protein
MGCHFGGGSMVFPVSCVLWAGYRKVQREFLRVVMQGERCAVE